MSAKPQLTLYHYWRSSCSWRVRWGLALKVLAYREETVNILAREHDAPAYRAISPSGLLPTLVVDGRAVGESLAILEWLEETVPEPPLLPRDPWARLKVRQLALTIAAGTQPLQNPATIGHYIKEPAERPAHMRFFIERGLKVYEDLLQEAPAGRFSWGDSVTLADLCLIPQVYNAKRFGVDLTALPRIAAIYDACLATAACAQAAPERQSDAAPG